MWLLDTSIITGVYYIQMMWYPYYFTQLGYTTMAGIISMIPPLALPFGSAFFSWINTSYGVHEKLLVPFCLIIMTLIQIILCVLEPTPTTTWIYIVLVGVLGFCHAYPEGVMKTTEL